MKTIITRVALCVLGVLAFTTSMNMYAGYPEYGTHLITYTLIGLMVIAAGYVFVRDERRAAGDPDDTGRREAGEETAVVRDDADV